MEDKLEEYNMEGGVQPMDLVMFSDAIANVTRIKRIISMPRGHGMLVGVGGSGKQSLARLTSFINSQDVLSILVNQNYGTNELKADLQEFDKKTAVKPAMPHAFLMTDGQIAGERFLVFINDMLSGGSIPDLFTREEYDGLFGDIRNPAKAADYSRSHKSARAACELSAAHTRRENLPRWIGRWKMATRMGRPCPLPRQSVV